MVLMSYAVFAYIRWWKHQTDKRFVTHKKKKEFSKRHIKRETIWLITTVKFLAWFSNSYWLHTRTLFLPCQYIRVWISDLLKRGKFSNTITQNPFSFLRNRRNRSRNTNTEKETLMLIFFCVQKQSLVVFSEKARDLERLY